jgi:DNA/RNA endonuclease YhcR with UshA esterase domain
MFERQERVAVFLLVGVALVVIVAHVVLAGLGKQPFARPFSNSSSDGELVVVEGQIDQISLTRNGGHMTVLVNNLSIFLPAQVVQDVSLQKGDRISVYGIVQTYRGKKEIMVNAADDIHIIPPKSP